MPAPQTENQFISKVKLIHFDKNYDYSKVNYINDKTKVTLVCSVHGDFEQIPAEIKRGKGCPLCVYDKRKLQIKEFIDKSNKVHDNKYDYTKTQYINSRTNLTIICPNHGEFFQSPSNHLRGNGCPHCCKSKGEKLIKKILEDNKIEFLPQHTFDDCKGKRRKLPFDFFLPSYNTVIEFDGRQHFEEIKGWGGEDKLKATQYSDSIKTSYCLKNNINLIRITYEESIEIKLQHILAQKSIKNF